MDWPAYGAPVNPILTTLHPGMLGYATQSTGASTNAYGSCGSIAWWGNNLAQYFPFRLHTHETAYQLLFFVGATSSGNICVAIYDSQLNRIVTSGSTAMSVTVNTWQQLNIADTALGPGEYLLGANCSTTGGFCFGAAAGADEIIMPVTPVYEQAVGAVALPDPAVPVFSTAGNLPRFLFGIQFYPTF